MKTKYFALAMAFALAMVLTGCSAGREENSTPMMPGNGVSGNPDSRNSAEVNTSSPSASSGVGNDALNGGGAGGTNDLDNDGVPDGDAGTGIQGQGRSRGGDALDNMGDAAGDVLRGAGDIARDAGDAIGNAANDAGNAMR